MTRLERVTKNISEDKNVRKRLTDAYNGGFEEFLKDADRYVKAIKERRMCCIIGSVSSSGMSRTMRFISCEKVSKTGYAYMNYYSLFVMAGYTAPKHSSYFRVSGCGMDMVFATHYDITSFLRNMGVISEKDCNWLRQQTPATL
jgi:hypothetical protein